MNRKKAATCSSFNFKGRSKKQGPRASNATAANRDNKDRPPTRRNPNDVLVTDKIRNAPISKAAKHTPSSKFKTTSTLGLQTPREKLATNAEQHEYLQFSLRITEEIIRSDMYKNDEMIQVLKQHYMVHKGRLNQERLLKTIAELCSELNIPMDDNMMLFLEDRGSYSRVCVQSNGVSPAGSPTTAFAMRAALTRPGTPPVSPRDAKFLHAQANQASKAMDEMKLHFAQPYDALPPSNENDCNSLGLHPINSEDRTSKQEPEISSEELPPAKGASACAVGVDTSGMGYALEVIKSPTAIDDLSKAFEFGEETLKAPGEESVTNVQLKECKEFRVLHDATARFARDSDKESDASLQLQAVGPSGSDAANKPLFVMNFEKPARKLEMNLVAAHYSTSVEPELVETKEFSVQVALDSSQAVDSDAMVDAPAWSGGQGLSDATTQKSIAFASDSEVGRRNPSVAQNTERPCHCDRGDRGRDRCRESEHAPCMTASEAQYVLLDCPVLIPREHTRSMDVLNNIANRNGGMERSFHALNLRMPTNNFVARPSMPAMPSGPLAAPSYKPDRPDLHNSDYYDLTPQKDLFQNKSSTASGNYHAPPMPFGCCSCVNPNMPPVGNDRYDKAARRGNMDRLDRYKKVNDNLSYFYPTIATQVSSMELLHTDANWNPTAHHQHHAEPFNYCNARNRRSQQHQQQQFDSPRAKVDHHRAIELSVSETASERSEDLPANVNAFNAFPRTPAIQAAPTPSTRERKETKINLDNYRIDSTPSIGQSTITGQKRPYGDDVTANREVSRNNARTQSNHPANATKTSIRTIQAPKAELPSEEEEEVSVDKTLGLYASNSNDSMEKRIMSLRHDIEKYSKDDLISKRNNGGDASNKRVELFDFLRANSLNGAGVLPSEVPLPRQRKMSVLRRQNKEKL